MQTNRKAKWIWVDKENKPDTYGEFYSEFDYSGGKVTIDLSVDSNYELYVNGKFVNSSQYSDFPHYKVYDTINITDYCVDGLNKLAIIVWYYGGEYFTYCQGNAGLWYVVKSEKGMLDCSGEAVLSRYSVAYKNGYLKDINVMSGLSYYYDSTKEDNWKNGELHGFRESVPVEQDLKLHARGIKKMQIQPPAYSQLVKREKNYYLYDVGREEVGYLTFKVTSRKKQLLTISYGEHMYDGRVRRKMGGRDDFSFEVVVGEGVTEYSNYFKRLGFRYIDISSEDELEIEYLTVRPCPYPLHFIDRRFENPVYQKIYDVSVRTLQLCMHEHYEDCPWREQALYAMDSRNQMLYGYYAFEEYPFARENLLLFSKDNRPEKILTICTPSATDLFIPSFSLHYLIAIYEYTVYSGDLSLAREVMPKVQEIIGAFTERMENGLVMNSPEERFWNFYEWSEDLAGQLFQPTDKKPEAALNCLFSLALQKIQAVCDMLGMDVHYAELAEGINREVRKVFFDETEGIYINNLDSRGKSELVNAWAVLCGASKGEEAERLCEILASDNDLISITLSMACFKYDALLAVNEEKYVDYVIQDLVFEYSMMLDAGATSFWEYTARRHGTFLHKENNQESGSLCHGWSALPVYYFTKYLKNHVMK